jgi:hypothetical protein
MEILVGTAQQLSQEMQELQKITDSEGYEVKFLKRFAKI